MSKLATKFTELEEAGMHLSKYAAAIKWKDGDNTQDWLDGLHERIAEVQALYKAREAALAASAEMEKGK